ncbi:hypothetical protein F5Y13DRAFT_189915 [Hypoxylon sp. FL1857]|nr:hypothetical protein F5Y13DRAFT_189915 [Hypoxylon sp. FL1857]
MIASYISSRIISHPVMITITLILLASLALGHPTNNTGYVQKHQHNCSTSASYSSPGNHFVGFIGQENNLSISYDTPNKNATDSIYKSEGAAARGVKNLIFLLVPAIITFIVARN